MSGQPRAPTVFEETPLSAASLETLSVGRGVVGRRCLGADQARTASYFCSHGQDLSSKFQVYHTTHPVCGCLELEHVAFWAEGKQGMGQLHLHGTGHLQLPWGLLLAQTPSQDRLLVERNYSGIHGSSLENLFHI